MFKFAFDDPNPGEGLTTSDGSESRSTDNREQAWILPFPPTSDKNSFDSKQPQVFDVVEFAEGDIQMRKTADTAVPEKLAPTSTDLVPGKYEGGYKLWEGAGDLVCYMHKSLRLRLPNKSILELGAGHALPSIYALKAGAANVDIADFNEDVLQDVTAINVRLNCPEEDISKLRLVAGDWCAVPDVLENSSYDFIFAAEVAYSLESLDKLAACIVRLLKPGGSAFVAGKTYYFGVGGGMSALRQALSSFAKASCTIIAMEIVEELRDGKSNVREILSITKPYFES